MHLCERAECAAAAPAAAAAAKGESEVGCSATRGPI